MSRFFRTAIAVILLASSLALPARAGEDQAFGLVTGAVVGGIVGNQFGHGSGRDAATAAGVLAGGWAGSDIGYAMDNRSAATTAAATANASVPRSLSGPTTYGNSYAPNYVAPDDGPSPESVYDASYGNYCREFSEEVRVGNQLRETYGTACLQPDGTWHAVEE